MPDTSPYSCFTKTIIVNGSPGVTKQRQYAVRQDATIITRYDEWDHLKTLESHRTDGWQEYKTETKFDDKIDATMAVQEKLLSLGYHRSF